MLNNNLIVLVGITVVYFRKITKNNKGVSYEFNEILYFTTLFSYRSTAYIMWQ